MANYTSPGVHIEDVISGSQTITASSASIGAMVGATRSGVVGKSQLVTSWQDFIKKYAFGLDTPFFKDSYLPYSVYGFFANGGQQLYISRIATTSAKKATATGTTMTKVEASTVGTWANDTTIVLKKGADFEESVNEEYDITVTVKGGEEYTVSGLTKDTIVDGVLENNSLKNLIGDFEIADSLAEETVTLTGGADGVTDLTKKDYETGLDALNENIEDITMISIPDGTTVELRGALLAYCEKNKVFPITNAPVGTSVEDCRKLRRTISATYGAMPYPWGILSDPLSGKEKLVPSDGAYMGATARTVTTRGEFKATAGTEATIYGFNSMEFALSDEDCKILNPVGVICIMPRRNFGIVVWGARGLNSKDSTMRYVSDNLLNIAIRKDLYVGTQFAVFEPNDSSLWARVKTTCRNYLENKRKAGAFKGKGEGDAWYVVVDESNNTDDTIAEGYLNIEIGYAPVKPAEFVVIKLAHSIN